MNWYDTFAWFYDLSIEWLYRSHRGGVREALALEPDSIVLDLACGTGQNFPFLAGEQRTVIGVDFSRGMLERARARVSREGFERFHLIEADARTLSRELLAAHIGTEVVVDRVVCTLGFTALPEWERCWQQAWDLLPPGGKMVIFTVHAESWVPQGTIVQLVARADISRRTWEPMEAAAAEFSLTKLPGSPHIHGGTLFQAVGVKG